MKNFLRQKKNVSVLLSVLAAIVFAESVVIAKLYTDRDVKKYEVNLMPVKMQKDSVDFAKMGSELSQINAVAKEFHSFLASKNISDPSVDALAQDSLKSAVYISGQTARYSRYLADLQEKLWQVPLGLPTDGYISSNFGKRKNPIPVKAKPKEVSVKTAAPQPQEQVVEEKDSLGNVTKKIVKTIPQQQPSAPKEVNNPPAEADQMQFHKGLDIAVAYGSDVRCAASGTVIFAGERGGYGNCIIISHGNGLDTLYGHLSEILVKTNDVVKVGQIIAKSGNTGRSTGPHLHYEVHKNGTPVNPKLFLGL